MYYLSPSKDEESISFPGFSPYLGKTIPIGIVSQKSNKKVKLSVSLIGNTTKSIRAVDTSHKFYLCYGDDTLDTERQIIYQSEYNPTGIVNFEFDVDAYRDLYIYVIRGYGGVNGNVPLTEFSSDILYDSYSYHFIATESASISFNWT